MVRYGRVCGEEGMWLSKYSQAEMKNLGSESRRYIKLLCSGRGAFVRLDNRLISYQIPKALSKSRIFRNKKGLINEISV